ncbi:uncharacterized protein LOC119668060 [Teleopsis dalmanni]|uniref:uncharacterized protein LOC119668060 n=1 Tax=Teleopsis dalmanni TaxID=139649 RepID=UPI0018CCD4C8|nr:uncharacterized protein LOC119668060 [Teleopsis dalmanni]
MQFGRVNIFELLCNTYKANRDLMDWSGNKPLDYSRQRTTVSDSTYSKIKAKKKHSEKDLGFLRIGSLNVRVKKTTEAFSNFLGVGSGSGNTMAQMVAANGGPVSGASRHHQRSHRHRHQLHQTHNGMTRLRMGNTQPMKTMTMTTPLGMSNQQLSSRASVPISNSKFDKIHKSWGSADNIPHNGKNTNMYTKDLMPPPKSVAAVKKRQKSSKHSSVTSSATTDSPRGSISSSNSSSNLYSGYCSMPTTPNQLRAPIGMASANNMGDSDSDSACGFDSNWSSVNSRGSLSSGNLQTSRFS